MPEFKTMGRERIERGVVKYLSPLSIRKALGPRARQEFMAHLRLPKDLRRAISLGLKETNSTGCTVWELERLWRSMLDVRPSRAVEFGSGISTLVIAHAVRKLADAGHVTRFVTMEQSAAYQENLLAWFPQELRSYVDFRRSDAVAELTSDGALAFSYRDTPDEPFDWCFVDGPDLPSCGATWFDADVLRLNKGQGLVIHIDGRLSTRQRLKQELHPSRVYRSHVHGWATLFVEGTDTNRPRP